MKVVCHNVNFDIRVVASEFVRAKMETPIAETCCTIKKVLIIVRLHLKSEVNINGHRYKSCIENALMRIWRMHIIVIMMLLIVPNVTLNCAVNCKNKQILS